MNKLIHKITVFSFLAALMVQPAEAMMNQVSSKLPKELKIGLISLGIIGGSIVGSSLIQLMCMSQDTTVKKNEVTEQKNESEIKYHSKDFIDCIDGMQIKTCEDLEYNDSEGTYLSSDIGKKLCDLWSTVYKGKKQQKLNEDLRWCDKKKSRYGIVNNKVVAFAIVDIDVKNEFTFNVISNSRDYAKNLASSFTKPEIFGKESRAIIKEDASNDEIVENKQADEYAIFKFLVKVSKE